MKDKGFKKFYIHNTYNYCLTKRWEIFLFIIIIIIIFLGKQEPY